MKINKLKIIDFQKHSLLELDFSDDLNIITGLTDRGKSSIFRALEWVLNLSNISEVDYRKEGTKKTSVKIWLDNGFQLERIRGNSINRYILSQKDSEDKVFDNFGKQTPEDIQSVLGISTIDIENEHLNLNFANQDQMNFLIDSTYSDTFKAKLFNKLTGNEVLDVLFKDLNKESLRINRETKATEELLKTQEEQLSEYSLHYKQLNKLFCSVNEKYLKVKEDIEIYENLKELSEQIKTNKESVDFVKFKVSKIKTISDDKLKQLKEQAKKLKMLQNLSHELEATNDAIEMLQKKKVKLSVINVDFEELKKQNNCIQTYKKLFELLNTITQKQEEVTIQTIEKQELLGNTEIELKELWEKCKICPLCGKEHEK
jgi:DNA repair ATPase RecN